MKNITITFSTSDNRTQANGYDPRFYESREKQCEDIINDLQTAKKLFGDKLIMITVTEWEESGDIESTPYRNIDEVSARYSAKD